MCVCMCVCVSVCIVFSFLITRALSHALLAIVSICILRDLCEMLDVTFTM